MGYLAQNPGDASFVGPVQYTHRLLSPYEVFDLYSRHPDIQSSVQAFEAQVQQAQQASGSSSIWSDIYNAALQYADNLNNLITAGYWDKFVQYFGPLQIPPAGMVVHDSVYGDVIVYPAPNGTAYFDVTDDPNVIAAVQKPVYSSDPNYLELYQSILAKLPSIPQINFGLGSLAVIAIVIALLWLTPRR